MDRNRAGLGIGALLAALAVAPLGATDAVVGTGTPGSCTESAFDLALGDLATGGGTLTFDCGPAAHTIVLTAPKPLGDDTGSNTVFVDGGGRITLSGGNATRLFTVLDQADVFIRNMTLTNGSAEFGGAILVAGVFGNPLTDLVLQNVTIRNSVAAHWGGGVGAQNSRIFVDQCRIVDNRADGAAGGGGGGISFNWGQLNITKSEISRNRALNGDGGGIEMWNASASLVFSRVAGNSADVPGGNPAKGGGIHLRGDDNGNTFILESWIVDNRAEKGGGISVYGEGQLRLETTTVSGNDAGASGLGGGMEVELNSSAYVTAVTFDDNTALVGGGISNYGVVELENVTISDNGARDGGGLYNSGKATLFDVTFADNVAFDGGAILDTGSPAEGPLAMRNTLFAGNHGVTSGSSCRLERTGSSIASSLWPDTTCGSSTASSNRPNTIVALQPLAFSCSGLATETTRTHAFASPINSAIDGGVCDALQTTVDQRGVARPQGAACDIGAFEEAAASCGALFLDGFESATPHAWSSSVP